MLRLRRALARLLAVAATVLVVAPVTPVHAAVAFDGVPYVTMLDSAFAPSADQVRSSGAQAWGGYLPAPEVYHAWSRTNFATVQSVVPVLPIYVPHQHVLDDATCAAEGHDAVRQAKANGVQLTISIDIEAGPYYDNPAGTTRCVVVWTAAVRADGGRGIPYAPLALLRRLNTGDVDGVWLAYWTNRPMDPEQGPLDPYRWSGMRAIQWQGGHGVSGVNVDTSSVDSGIFGAHAPAQPHIRLAAPMVAGAAVPRLAGAVWEAGADGGVFAQDGAPFYGSMGGKPLAAPVVGVAGTPEGLGYWLTARDGGVFSFGNATFHGSMGGRALNAPVVGLTAARGGYWLVASDGGVFSFGVPFLGSEGGQRLNQPVAAIAATPDGGGYWLVARDGGVFSFGTARFYGSMGGRQLNAPMVGIAPTATGRGYWLVAADGGVFAFGDAEFYGSMGGRRMNAPVVGIVPTSSDRGYALVGADGGSFNFGDAHLSSLVG